MILRDDYDEELRISSVLLQIPTKKTNFYWLVRRMWKSEQPPDAVLSPTWSLTDVCGSLDILPAAHHKRTTTVLSRR